MATCKGHACHRGEEMDSAGGSEWFMVLMLLIWVLVPIPFIIKRPPDGPNRFGAVPGRPMEFVEAVKAFFANFLDFSGRASRSEFWWAILFCFVVGIVASFLPFLDMIWTLIAFVPSISLSARRLHDINRSGWLQLLSASFPIGTVAVIIWYCRAPREAEEMNV